MKRGSIILVINDNSFLCIPSASPQEHTNNMSIFGDYNLHWCLWGIFSYEEIVNSYFRHYNVKSPAPFMYSKVTINLN